MKGTSQRVKKIKTKSNLVYEDVFLCVISKWRKSSNKKTLHTMVAKVSFTGSCINILIFNQIK